MELQASDPCAMLALLLATPEEAAAVIKEDDKVRVRRGLSATRAGLFVTRRNGRTRAAVLVPDEEEDRNQHAPSGERP